MHFNVSLWQWNSLNKWNHSNKLVYSSYAKIYFSHMTQWDTCPVISSFKFLKSSGISQAKNFHGCFTASAPLLRAGKVTCPRFDPKQQCLTTKET